MEWFFLKQWAELAIWRVINRLFDYDAKMHLYVLRSVDGKISEEQMNVIVQEAIPNPLKEINLVEYAYSFRLR